MYMYVCLTKTMVRYMVSCAWVHEFQTLVKKKKKKVFSIFRLLFLLRGCFFLLYGDDFMQNHLGEDSKNLGSDC